MNNKIQFKVKHNVVNLINFIGNTYTHTHIHNQYKNKNKLKYN